MRAKRLQRHTLPVLLSLIAVFMVSVVVAAQVGNSHKYVGSSISLADKALTTSLIRITPNKDGLAKISLSDDTVAAKPAVPLLSTGKEVGGAISTNVAIQQMITQPKPN
jgi:hypothetical protein